VYHLSLLLCHIAIDLGPEAPRSLAIIVVEAKPIALKPTLRLQKQVLNDRSHGPRPMRLYVHADPKQRERTTPRETVPLHLDKPCASQPRFAVRSWIRQTWDTWGSFLSVRV